MRDLSTELFFFSICEINFLFYIKFKNKILFFYFFPNDRFPVIKAIF